VTSKIMLKNVAIASLDEQEHGGTVNRNKLAKGRSCGFWGKKWSILNWAIGFGVQIELGTSISVGSYKWKPRVLLLI
jgi:hypothetical protein